MHLIESKEPTFGGYIDGKWVKKVIVDLGATKTLVDLVVAKWLELPMRNGSRL